MIKIIQLFILTFLCTGAGLNAQEICDNGVDDDGDGLIDLNDVADCSCSLFALTPSLLPNPSFEYYTNGPGCASNLPNGQPDRPGQIDCLEGWERGSIMRPSPWNLLTYNGDTPYYPRRMPTPVPDGVGVGGFSIYQQLQGMFPPPPFSNYFGACLPQGPLEAGASYRLEFELGFGATFESASILSHSPSPVTITLFAANDCASLPFDSRFCPLPDFGLTWDGVGSATVVSTAESWETVRIDFTAQQPYQAFAIGASCSSVSIPGPYEGYNAFYYLDKLILNTVAVHESADTVGGIKVSGYEICADDAQMEVNFYSDATYQWYKNGVAIPGATSTTYYPVPGEDFAGDYSCRITRPNGCGVAGPVQMVYEPVTENFPDSIYFCPWNDNIILPLDEHAVADYLWEDGSRQHFLRVDEPGDYSVTITSFCVETVETIVLTDAVEPHYNLVTIPGPVCSGDSIGISLQSNWLITGGLVVNGQYPGVPLGDTIMVLAGQDNFVELEIYGDACRSRILEELVLEQEQLNFGVFHGAFSCSTTEVEVFTQNLPGDPADYLFEWRDANGNLISEAPAFIATQAGDYGLTLRPLSEACVQTRSFNIPYYSFGDDFSPEVSLIEVDPCQGIFNVSVDAYYTNAPWLIEWFTLPDTSLLASGPDSLTDLIPGDYLLRIGRTDGDCSGQRVFRINPPPAISFVSEVLPFECPAEDSPVASGTIRVVAFNGVGPYRYLLDGPLATESETGLFTELPGGTYAVTVIDANGCPAEQFDTLSVILPILANVEAGENDIINLGEELRLNARLSTNLSGTFSWWPEEGLSCADCPDPIAAPFSTTTYQVSFTNSSGCITSDSVTVRVVPTGKMYLPTAFSPNFDGVNDRFEYYPDASFQALLDFRVFDRWGAEVYAADPQSSAPIGWDGNDAIGKPYKSGVYVYFLQIRLLNGQTLDFNGEVLLLR